MARQAQPEEPQTASARLQTTLESFLRSSASGGGDQQVKQETGTDSVSRQLLCITQSLHEILRMGRALVGPPIEESCSCEAPDTQFVLGDLEELALRISVQVQWIWEQYQELSKKL